MRAIAQLCVEDRMRLLPNQQWPNRRGTIATFGSDHLWPAGAAIALRFCAFPRGRKNRGVPGETFFQQRHTIPNGEMRGVPPVHFQVKLAIPTVAGESALLRRHRAGTLNRSWVLREDDATLEFRCPLIAAVRKIDRATLAPKSGPMCRRETEGRACVWEIRQRCMLIFRREGNDEFETFPGRTRLNQKFMRLLSS